MYEVKSRVTREDGRPQADLYGPDHAFVRVIGAEAHALVQGGWYALSFVAVDAPAPAPAPAPHGHVMPLVAMSIGGSVRNPK